MSDDFCFYHGYEHMKFDFGNDDENTEPVDFTTRRSEVAAPPPAVVRAALLHGVHPGVHPA